MVFAADYPFLDILWSMIIFFAWVAWIWMLIIILSDVIRRRDIGGWAKAGWCAFMVVVPFIGVLTYLIAQHDGIAQRRLEDVQQADAQLDARIRSVAQSDGGATAEIERAARLRDSGAISDVEFQQLKQRALTTA